MEVSEPPSLFPAEATPTSASTGADRVESSSDGRDEALESVAGWFLRQRDLADRFGEVFRRAIDEVLDGARTGRFDLADSETVGKTERTYLGTKVEIIVRAEFRLERGASMDYRVEGHDIDAKFSRDNGWAIPIEAMGHLCLVMKADDHRGRFSVGVIRISPDVLNQGRNRDGKRTLSTRGRSQIRWLVDNHALPPNQLLELDPTDRDAVLSAGSGQGRVTEFLRRYQGRIVHRTTGSTLARQHDPMKRFRDARTPLAPQGIIVLSHQKDSPRVAAALGLPVPAKGQYIAARIVPAPAGDERPTAWIGDQGYVIARPEEPPHPAPFIDY